MSIKKYKKYFSFYGRAKRKEYWIVLLSTILPALIAISFPLIMNLFTDSEYFIVASMIFAAIFFGLSAPLLFWSVWATSTRRCRDMGINPWWVLLLLIPIVGGAFVIIYGCVRSSENMKSESY